MSPETEVTAVEVIPVGTKPKIITAGLDAVAMDQLEYLIEHFRLSGWNVEHQQGCQDCLRFLEARRALLRVFE